MTKYVLPVPLLCLLITVNICAQSKTISLLDLTAKQGFSKADASFLTDIAQEALFRHSKGRYRVIARGMRDQLLKEQKFVLSDLCDDMSCAVEVGRLLGADYMLFGTLGEYEGTNHVIISVVDVTTSEITATARESTDSRKGLIDTIDACIALVITGKKTDTKDALPLSSEPSTSTPAGTDPMDEFWALVGLAGLAGSLVSLGALMLVPDSPVDWDIILVISAIGLGLAVLFL